MALGHFGFQHGDLVVTHEGHVATVIGLKEPSQDVNRQFSGGNPGEKLDGACFLKLSPWILKIIQKCSLKFRIETFLVLGHPHLLEGS